MSLHGSSCSWTWKGVKNRDNQTTSRAVPVHPGRSTGAFLTTTARISSSGAKHVLPSARVGSITSTLRAGKPWPEYCERTKGRQFLPRQKLQVSQFRISRTFLKITTSIRPAITQTTDEERIGWFGVRLRATFVTRARTTPTPVTPTSPMLTTGP